MGDKVKNRLTGEAYLTCETVVAHFTDMYVNFLYKSSKDKRANDTSKSLTDTYKETVTEYANAVNNDNFTSSCIAGIMKKFAVAKVNLTHREVIKRILVLMIPEEFYKAMSDESEMYVAIADVMRRIVTQTALAVKIKWHTVIIDDHAHCSDPVMDALAVIIENVRAKIADDFLNQKAKMFKKEMVSIDIVEHVRRECAQLRSEYARLAKEYAALKLENDQCKLVIAKSREERDGLRAKTEWLSQQLSMYVSQSGVPGAQDMHGGFQNQGGAGYNQNQGGAGYIQNQGGAGYTPVYPQTSPQRENMFSTPKLPATVSPGYPRNEPFNNTPKIEAPPNLPSVQEEPTLIEVTPPDDTPMTAFIKKNTVKTKPTRDLGRALNVDFDV